MIGEGGRGEEEGGDKRIFQMSCQQMKKKNIRKKHEQEKEEKNKLGYKPMAGTISGMPGAMECSALGVKTKCLGSGMELHHFLVSSGCWNSSPTELKIFKKKRQH